jgi:hypothetical protein
MTSRVLTAGLAALLFTPDPALSQESAEQGWVWVPAVSFVRMFPGIPVEHHYENMRTFGPSGSVSYRYDSYGAQGSVRGLSRSLEPLAVTISAGIHWYARSDRAPDYVVAPAAAGVGEQLAPGDFTVFPLSAGLQLVLPSRPARGLIFFAGAEGQLVFVDGNVDMNQQVKGGLALAAGFSVGTIECGVRYMTFSDIRNLGIQIGLRLQALSP